MEVFRTQLGAREIEHVAYGMQQVSLCWKPDVSVQIESMVAAAVYFVLANTRFGCFGSQVLHDVC